MTLQMMYDCSSPIEPPTEFTITAGYIGSPGATPHVWTKDEWVTKSYRARLPIYVPSFFHTGSTTPLTDAQQACQELTNLNVPTNTTVGLDFETHIAPGYVSFFDQYMRGAGYHVLIYGSSSTIFHNPKPSMGYWVATRRGNPDYPGDRMLYPGSVATQWAENDAFDSNVIMSSVPLWGATNLATTWMDNVVNTLPLLQQNATGDNVRTLQGLLNARGANLRIDGMFGPLTESEVRHEQGAYAIQIDGIVGEHTWASLILNQRQ